MNASNTDISRADQRVIAIAIVFATVLSVATIIGSETTLEWFGENTNPSRK